MKHKLHISFFCFALAAYLLMHIGVPVFKHYCGGELESTSVFVKHTSCCGEAEDEPSDCCKDEVQVAHNYPDGVLSKVNEAPQITQLMCYFSNVIFCVDKKIKNEAFSNITHPFKLRQLLEVNCSVFRI